MQKITPCLWFDDNAEEAVNFYTGIFKNSKIGKVSRYGESTHGEKGRVMTIAFELEGLSYLALNGGPHFKFSEAISLMVHCDTQQEIDSYWEKLLAGGGKESQCGWLKDKFGLSWQIVPSALPELISATVPERAERAMQALMKMVKIDIAALKRASEQS